MQAIWKEQSADSGGETQAEFAKRIHSEIEKWHKVVETAGVKLD
jgi:tripartite-type tricarboxylate transporter receptor subunit TctC